MLKLTIVLGIAICGASLLGFAQSATSSETPEVRDIEMANETILTSLAVDASPKGRSLCFDNKVACLGPVPVQLGLSLIASRQTPRSMTALVRLLRFRMEGANDESLDCEIVQKGRFVEKALRSLSAQELNQACHREFTELLEHHSAELQGLGENAVCLETDSIELRIKEDLDAIRHGRRCDKK